MLASASLAAAGGCGHRSPPREPPEALIAVHDGFDELAQRVQQHVSDPQRSATLQGLVQRARSEFVEVSRAMADEAGVLAALDDGALANRAAVSQMLDEHADALAAALTKICLTAAEARRTATAQEWALVFRTEDASAAAMVVSMQSAEVGVAGSLGAIDVHDLVVGYWADSLDTTVRDGQARTRAATKLTELRTAKQELADMLQRDGRALHNVNLQFESPLQAYAPVIEAIRSHVANAHGTMLDSGFSIRAAIGDPRFTKIRRRVGKQIARGQAQNRKEAKRRAKATRKAQRQR